MGLLEPLVVVGRGVVGHGGPLLMDDESHVLEGVVVVPAGLVVGPETP